MIRLARAALLRRTACATTSLFVRTAGALSRPPLSPDVLTALQAPYRTASRRRAVDDFVADIPLEPGTRAAHRSTPSRHGLEEWRTCRRWLWGARDPVFTDRYLRDLLYRLPHAQVHRYETASHLVTGDSGSCAARLSRLSTATLWQRLRAWWTPSGIAWPESVRLYRGTDTPRTSR